MRWRDVPPLTSNPEDPSKPTTTSSVTSPDEPQIKSRSHYFNMLLLAGYYTLCVPMKVTLDRNSNEYIFKEWIVQKVLCYLFWTLSTINRLTVLRRTYANTTNFHTTASYFRLTHALLHIIYYAIYYHMISSSSSSILAFLNGMRTSSLFDMTKTRNRVIRMSLIITQVIWLVLTITAIPLGYELLNSSCWSLRNLTHACIVHGRYTFFKTSKILPEADTSEYSGVDVVLGIGQVLVTTSNVVLLFFIVCLFGNYAAALWTNASGLCEAILTKLKQSGEDQVERNEESESPQVLELFEQATAVSTPLNSTFQLLAFWYMLDLISWLSTELVSGLRTDDYFVKMHIFYYLSYIGITLCFSAEAFRRIEHLKNMLRTRDRTKLTEKNNDDLDNLFKYLQIQIFGIGETGFFKLNYPFIGQITGLIVTFYIISIGEIRRMREERMDIVEIRNMTNCYLT